MNGLVRELVIEAFKNEAAEAASTIHAIVTASNHVHGIVTLPGGEKISLSQFIGKAKVKTSQQLRGQASPPLRDAIWQRSFYDHVIRDEKDFLEKAQYIEKHPMKEEGDVYAEWH